MTLFKLLLQSTGLSTREAACFLNVSLDTVKSWNSGRNNCPDGALNEMSELIDRQNGAADAVLDVIEGQIGRRGDPEGIVIGYCADDDEAQELGWPFKSCHDAVIRRVIESLDEGLRETVVLSPRK